MTKKERVMAVVRGQKPDYTPCGFWYHFPKETWAPEIASKTHLEYFRKTGTDFCKVMNENSMIGTFEIKTPADLRRFKLSDDTKRVMSDQIELLKRVVDGVAGDGVVLSTIYGVVACAHHATMREGVFVEHHDFYRACIRENIDALGEVYKVVAEVLYDLTRRSLEIGADGIFYAALGGESDLFTPEQYWKYVTPLEKEIFRIAEGAPCCNVLHVCKPGIDLARFGEYPGDVVNWGAHDLGNPDLEEGFRLFPGKTILGGLHGRSGAIINGTEAEIETEIHTLLEQAGDRRFILGADCTLIPGTPVERVAMAAAACRSYRAKN